MTCGPQGTPFIDPSDKPGLNKKLLCYINNYIYFVLCEFHVVFLRWQLTVFQLEGVAQWEDSWLRREAMVGGDPWQRQQP